MMWLRFSEAHALGLSAARPRPTGNLSRQEGHRLRVLLQARAQGIGSCRGFVASHSKPSVQLGVAAVGLSRPEAQTPCSATYSSLGLTKPTNAPSQTNYEALSVLSAIARQAKADKTPRSPVSLASRAFEV